MYRSVGRNRVLKWIAELIGLAAFILLIGTVSPASAAEGDFSAEFMGGLGFGPDDPDFDFGVKFGPGLGFGYEVNEYIQLRTDVSYFKWTDDATVCNSGGCPRLSFHLRDIPIFLGGRLFLPVIPDARLFGELGVSLDIMKAELSGGGGSGSLSDSKLKVGLVPGLGFDFMVTPDVSLGLNARYHLLSKGVGEFEEGGTTFFSVAVLAAYYF